MSINIPDQSKIIPLWPEGVPGLENPGYEEVEEYLPAPLDYHQLRNVTKPELIPFIPDPAVANGTGVVICPGGAFHVLAIDHEGIEVARWFQERGVAAFVLKYRLQESPAERVEFEKYMEPLIAELGKIREVTREVTSGAIQDGIQAMQLVRQNASVWNLNPEKIGIMGFSAGGRVTAGVVLEGAGESRPDFAAPIYGALWEELTVPLPAPPLFIAVANDDSIAAESCLELYSAWRSAGQPVELHIYAKGGHGFGMRKQGLPSDAWIEQLGEWLRSEGFL